MDSDIVTVLVDIIDISSYLYSRIKLDSCVYRKEWVIADNVHAKCNGCVCDLSADSTKTYNTKCLAQYLRTCELRLAALNSLRSVRSALE